jgi:hypothetical protein
MSYLNAVWSISCPKKRVTTDRVNLNFKPQLEWGKVPFWNRTVAFLDAITYSVTGHNFSVACPLININFSRRYLYKTAESRGMTYAKTNCPHC